MTQSDNTQPLSPIQLAELKRLTAGRAHGSLQQSDCDRLEQILSESSEARSSFIAYMQVEAALKWRIRGTHSMDALRRFSKAPEPDTNNSAQHPSGTASRRLFSSRRLYYVTTAIAASLIFLLASSVWHFFGSTRVESSGPFVSDTPAAIPLRESNAAAVAQVVAMSSESHWFLENRGDGEENVRIGDTIRLTRGQLRLDFACGATVTMKSPAALQVISPKRTRAILGTLKAHAGVGAEGFTVETPRTTVVDLGTDFGINVTRHGSTDVAVFNGAIDLQSDGVKGLSSSQRLKAGEGVRVSSEGAASRIVSILDSQFSVPDSVSARIPRVPVISAVHDNIRRGESWHYYEIVHGGMREDAKAFVDRKDHEWNGVDASGMPSYLLGGDYVKTFNDDKVNRAVEIDVTIERPAILFILPDRRSPIPTGFAQAFMTPVTSSAWTALAFSATGERRHLPSEPA